MEPTKQQDARKNIGFTVDVLLICAMYDEYVQVLNVKEGLDKPWHEHVGPNGWMVADGCFSAASGKSLNIRATHADNMGRERAQAIASALLPARCIAMTGICAGWRGKVALGDVIFADQLWSYDAGKITTENGEQRFQGNWLPYSPPAQLRQRMNQKILPPNAEQWLTERPLLPLEHQERWVLLRILAGENPCEHADFKAECPNWIDVRARLREQKWLHQTALKLTSEGNKKAKDLNLDHPDGLLPKPACFRIHVAPMATGAAVVEDAKIFNRIADTQRKILGLEMEASALGTLGEIHGIPVLVAKGVSDYGDSFKDDRYRHFAARAAAECLIALLRNADDLIPGRNGHGAIGHNDIPRNTTPSGDVAKLSVPTSLKKPRVLLEQLFASPPEGIDIRAICINVLPCEFLNRERINREHIVMTSTKLVESLLERKDSLFGFLHILLANINDPDLLVQLKDAICAAKTHYRVEELSGQPTPPKVDSDESPILLVAIQEPKNAGRDKRCDVQIYLYQSLKKFKVYKQDLAIDNEAEKMGFIDTLRCIIFNSGIDKKKLVIEFALPLSLLSEGVDQWADLGGRPLGTRWPVVVRSLERLEKQSWQLDWHEYWEILMANFDTYLDDINIKKRLWWPKDFDEIQYEIKTGVCVALDKVPNSFSENNNILFQLAYNGAPLVLWARRKDGLADMKPEIEKHLLNKTLGQLPGILRGIREQLWKEKRKDAIGYHLSLLWDDPTHGLPLWQDDDDFLPGPI